MGAAWLECSISPSAGQKLFNHAAPAHVSPTHDAQMLNVLLLPPACFCCLPRACRLLQIASDGLKGRVVEVCLADLQNVSTRRAAAQQAQHRAEQQQQHQCRTEQRAV